MQVSYQADDRPYVADYEVGDLVRLRIHETGEGAMGRAGHSGCVIAVHGSPASRLDIQLGGYSERRSAPLQRLIGVSRSIVLPCDPQGAPLVLPPRTGLRRSRQPAGQGAAVQEGARISNLTASLMTLTFTVVLAVAAMLAFRNLGAG